MPTRGSVDDGVLRAYLLLHAALRVTVNGRTDRFGNGLANELVDFFID